MNNNIKAIAFDLDGTIYFGNELAKNALDVIEKIKDRGIEVFYFTNNSMKTRKEIYRKLLDLGIKVEIEKIYNSAYATSIYLRESEIKKAYILGSDGLKEEVKNQGLITGDSKNLDAVVVGLNQGLNYDELVKVINILKNSQVKFIACNVDKNFPVENEKIMPGCGATISFISTASEKEVDYIIGKPNIYMIELLANKWGYNKNDILVVGDTYDSDIAMANNYGCKSLLIDWKNTLDYPCEKINTLEEILEYI